MHEIPVPPELWTHDQSDPQWRINRSIIKKRRRSSPGDLNWKKVKAMRVLIRERDGDNCCHCAKPIDFEGRLTPDSVTLEHKVPICFGGSGDIDNLALAHKECNERAARDMRRRLKAEREKLAQANLS